MTAVPRTAPSLDTRPANPGLPPSALRGCRSRRSGLPIWPEEMSVPAALAPFEGPRRSRRMPQRRPRLLLPGRMQLRSQPVLSRPTFRSQTRSHFHDGGQVSSAPLTQPVVKRGDGRRPVCEGVAAAVDTPNVKEACERCRDHVPEHHSRQCCSVHDENDRERTWGLRWSKLRVC